MKKYFVKGINIVLSLAMIFSLFSLAGCGEGKSGSGTGEKLFKEPVEFSVLAYEHTAHPFTGNELMFEALKEATNVNLKIDITPQSEYNNKITTVFASGQLYDITYMNTNSYIRSFSTSLFFDFTDYLETDLKDYYKWVKDDPNHARTYIDGRLYQLIKVGPGDYPKYEVNNLYGNFPVIRHDILEANNLPVPETWNQWFTVMKKLKAIYPDSTPWTTRSARTLLRYSTHALGSQMDLYYDHETGKYSFGVMEKDFRENLQFLINCYNEGIIDPNFDTANTNTWENAVTSGKAFFWYDNNSFAPTQNAVLKQSNPDANLEVMPLMENFQGKKLANQFTTSWYGEGFVCSAKVKEPQKMLKFINWLYTDDGLNITNYGKEGVTYTVNKDGSIKLTDAVLKEFANKTNAATAFGLKYGTGVFAGVVTEGTLDKALTGLTTTDAYNILKDDYDKGYIKMGVVDPSLPGDKLASINDKAIAINNTIFNGVLAIVMGKRDISTLDGLITQIKDMGAQEVLDAYNAALPK